MKCVITGEETNTLTKNVPLSKKGRELLNDLVEDYNNKLHKMYVDKFIEMSDNKSESLAEAIADRIKPKVTKHELLQAIAVHTVEGVFEQFEQKEESDEESNNE